MSQTKESNISSATNKTGVFSNTEVQVNVSKNSASIALTADNKEGVINEIMKTLTPMSGEFVANAVKVVGQTTDIIAVVWDEWKKMGDFEKILVAIAAAMIVGAVGYAAGCGDWHVIGGNWDTIKKTANHAIKLLGENAAEITKKLNSNVVVKKLQTPFDKKLPTTSMKIDDVKNLVRMGHAKVILPLLAGLPLFATGIRALGDVEDETKAALKKGEQSV